MSVLPNGVALSSPYMYRVFSAYGRPMGEPPALRWPFQLMTARSTAALPVGARWAFEPKFDGFRGCAWWGRDGQVRLQSRQGRSLTDAFPEIAAAVAEQCTPGTVLDGEIVCWGNGALDFTALLGRMGGARTPGACLAVFDLLADARRDLRGRPYLARRARLAELLGGCRLPLLVVPHTRDRRVASAWLTEHAEAGIEGVVAKRTDQHYNAARNAWRKIRTRLSAEALIVGVIGDPAKPQALVLGCLDARTGVRIAGRTAPLPPQARVEVGCHLRPTAGRPRLGTLHPRFGEQHPLTYTRVQPRLVVELEVDTARDNGRWRHPVIFRRLRLLKGSPSTRVKSRVGQLFGRRPRTAIPPRWTTLGVSHDPLFFSMTSACLL